MYTYYSYYSSNGIASLLLPLTRISSVIATKLAECDFSSQEKKATTMISDYNSIIIDRLNSSYR